MLRSSYECLRTSGTGRCLWLPARCCFFLLDGCRHLIPHALRIDAVDTEHDVPLAGEEVAADVAGSGVSAREEELRPRGAAPAAEAGGLGEIVSTRVEDADIDDVARAVTERRGHGAGVAV